MSLFDEPPASIRLHKHAAEKIVWCRALSAGVLQRNAQSAADILRMGELLAEAKEEVGHGNWSAFLQQQWPDLPKRTAQRWMKDAKSATVALLESRLRSGSHPDEAADDEPQEGENEDEGQPPTRRKRGRVVAGPPPTAARLLVKEFDATFGPLNRLIDKVQVYFSRQERFEAVKQLLNSLLVERKKWLREVEG